MIKCMSNRPQKQAKIQIAFKLYRYLIQRSLDQRDQSMKIEDMTHRSFKHFHHLNPFAKKSIWAIFLPIPLAFGNGISLNLKTRDGQESSQSSHRKSPKSPYGGISLNLLNETCRASNSVWKIGITSFIRMTQSKVGPFQKSRHSSKKPNFQSV